MISKDDSIDGLVLPSLVARGLQKAGGFSRLARRLPDSRALAKEAAHHNSLSDVVRLRILWALDASELCPCVLKRVAHVSDSKLSYHLSVLGKSGLIRSRRTRNWRIYFITESGRSVLAEARKRMT